MLVISFPLFFFPKELPKRPPKVRVRLCYHKMYPSIPPISRYEVESLESGIGERPDNECVCMFVCLFVLSVCLFVCLFTVPVPHAGYKPFLYSLWMM